jgi:GNAT superfamily N-acetyltransferase
MQIEVRSLHVSEVPAADKVFRDAFSTFLGVAVLPGTDLIGTRLRAAHTAGFAAYADGELAGSTLLSRWGSVAYFGPLSVTPRLWGHGIGARLVDAAVTVLDGWGARHQGLFTFAQSPRHHRLYQRFGFWPRFLTAIMSRPLTGAEPALGWRLSAAAPADRLALMDGCADITDAVYPGLDVRGEIDAVLDQGLGDVVLIGEPGSPRGFAVCHAGPGTEAGSGTAYIKFAAVRPGPGVGPAFGSLLAACEGFAAEAGARRLTLGVNTARHEAYRELLAAGFRTDVPGVTMHRPNEPGYDREDVRLLDDWR